MADGSGNVRLSSEVVVLKPFTEKIAQRLCLHCGKKFRSAGIHNRICPKCTPTVDRIYSNRIVNTSNFQNSDQLGYDE